MISFAFYYFECCRFDQYNTPPLNEMRYNNRQNSI